MCAQRSASPGHEGPAEPRGSRGRTTPRDQSAAGPDNSALPLAVALIPGSELRAAIAWAARGLVRFEFCDVLRDAELLSTREGAVVLFTFRYDLEGALADELIARLRLARPHLPIVLVNTAKRTDALPAREPVPAADGTVVEGSRHFRREVSGLVTGATRRARRRAMASALTGLVSPPVQSVVGAAIEHGQHPQSVRQLAASVGVPRKTLDRRLGKAINLTARQLIGWGRLLAAAMCLENPLATVTAVAVELEFASPSALRNLLQRYAGLTPTELRDRGGADFLFEQLRRKMGSDMESERTA